MMDDLKNKAEQLKEHVSEYVKTSIDLAKAKATRLTSRLAAGLVIGIIGMILGIFFFGFLFLSLAWWLSSLLGSNTLGFLCVAGIFLLLLIIVFALRKKVIVPAIRNSIISAIYDKEN